MRQRKPTQNQLAFLKLLYRFRFGTTEYLARASGKKENGQVYWSLRKLEEAGFVGRNYEADYKLRGKFASYYLTPAGIKVLKEIPDNSFSAKVLHSIYNDRVASDEFISHKLSVFQAYCLLKGAHGSDVQFFTASDLKNYDYFPDPLPDGYVRLTDRGQTRQFFLEIFEQSRPFFLINKKIKQYIEFKNSGQWDDDFPTVLFVADSPALERKIINRLKQFSEVQTEVSFAVTNLTDLVTIENAPEVWKQPDREEERLALPSIGLEAA